jgi:hypothetical protein
MGNYLEQHPEISSVGGATLGVGKYGSTLTANYTYKNMIDYSNLHNSFFERLESHSFGQPEYRTGAMYRLMRAEVMTLLLQTFSGLSKISTPYIFEVTGEIVVNGLGKSIYLNDLYWVRNWINHQVEHKDWNRKLYFQEWWGSEKYSEENITSSRFAYSTKLWNTNAMSRSAGCFSVTSCSPMVITPPSGISSPAIHRKVVVFPQPDGPMKAVTFFSGISRLIFFNA